jgi:hypothetical protein
LKKTENKSKLEKVEKEFKDIADKRNKRSSIIESGSKSEVYTSKISKTTLPTSSPANNNIETNHKSEISPTNTSSASSNIIKNDPKTTQSATQPSQKGPSMNIKMEFDPQSGEVVGVKPDIKMSSQDAKNIYNNNRETIHSVASTSGKFVKQVAESQKKDNNDPLTNKVYSNLFGQKK